MHLLLKFLRNLYYFSTFAQTTCGTLTHAHKFYTLNLRQLFFLLFPIIFSF